MTRGQTDFDIAALYTALDAKRRSLGMSWQEAARAISARFAHVPARPISPSTLTGLRSKEAIEGDGVLQMLLWLERTPESFVPGHREATAETAALPDVGPYRILRFDTGRLYSELDAQRRERGMTWEQAAREIGGFSAAGLTRLSKGGRTGFPHVLRLAGWLRRPAARFTRAADR